jgi:pimeloyl-ACP methyl ester carboxylesterase
MNIDSLEAVRIGGITQWIRVRGADTTNPVLLLMQQGPGLPIINETRRLQRLLRLEEEYTVVYWDQRGTGLSALPLRKSGKQFEISASLMVADVVELLELLRERFGRPSVVAGFSFGATFAALAAARRPDLVAALVATGMDIDIPLAERSTYEFVLSTARRRGNRRAVRQLLSIGAPPHPTVEQFTTRARWAATFGGVSADATFATLMRRLLADLIRSPDYPPAAIARTLRGIGASQAALLPQLADTDLVHTLPRLDIPVVLAQGRLDQVAPGSATEHYYDALTAPSKRLVWFEKSAHTPQYDEPEKFRDLLLSVKETWTRSTPAT